MNLMIIDELDLEEISGVDSPAQPTAKATIIKRDNGRSKLTQAISKSFLARDTKEKDFKSQLAIQEQDKKLWEARDKLYPMFDALTTTISNIVSDPNLSHEEKVIRVKQNSDDFSVNVIAEIPDVVSELTKLFEQAGISSPNTTQETNMSEKDENLVKALEEQKNALEKAANLQKQLDFITSLTAEQLEVYKALDKKEREELDDLSDEDKKKKLTQKSNSDEVVKFEGKEIRKSAVGEEAFALYKRMDDMRLEVQKAKDAEEMVRLEKRASEEFKHLAGTPAEIASVLKAIETLDNSTKETIQTIMKTAEEAAANAYVQKGAKIAADEVELKKKAQAAKIAEIQETHKVSKSRAMELAASEDPKLFT